MLAAQILIVTIWLSNFAVPEYASVFEVFQTIPQIFVVY